jgi:hypothetical protein
MDRCLGGTKSQPCTNKTKYTLEWVMENVDLCADHYEQEDNAKKLRKQIALEIEKQLADTTDVAEDFTFEIWNKVVTMCAQIARGK